jgi:hypothetical protein
MPERSEILVWSYVAAHYTDGHQFTKFVYTNSKLMQRSEYKAVHLSSFTLSWKSYGKRLIAQS